MTVLVDLRDLIQHLIFPTKRFLLVMNVASVKSIFSDLKAIRQLSSEKEFNEVVESSKENGLLHVIEYAKSLCKPCKRIAPEYEKMSETYDGKVLFFKVDSDNAPEVKTIMKNQGIRSVPSFHLWQSGSKVDSINGAFMEDLEECIESYIRSFQPPSQS
eukprot:gene1058-2068_t